MSDYALFFQKSASIEIYIRAQGRNSCSVSATIAGDLINDRACRATRSTAVPIVSVDDNTPGSLGSPPPFCTVTFVASYGLCGVAYKFPGHSHRSVYNAGHYDLVSHPEIYFI